MRTCANRNNSKKHHQLVEYLESQRKNKKITTSKYNLYNKHKLTFFFPIILTKTENQQLEFLQNLERNFGHT